MKYLTYAALWVVAGVCAAAALLFGLLLAVIGCCLRALPWILVIGFVLWMVTGCVYQPIHVEVYIPTTVQTGGDVVLDTVGNKLSEVAE